MSLTAAAPIPTPPDFPVRWERPEDARLFWSMDRLHWPGPVTPLDTEVLLQTVWDAIEIVAEVGMPLRGRAARVNTYTYTTMIPPDAPPDEDAARAKMGAAMASLGRRWSAEWLPEIEQLLAAWRTFDLPGASLAGLRAHLDETLARLRRLWELHFLIVLPAHLAVATFQDGYRELFPDEPALAAFRLVQGFDNKVLETDLALWRLSRRAQASPAIAALLRGPAKDVLAGLERSPEGRAFAAEFRRFLETYGRRGDQVLVSQASWLENPTPVIETLRAYLAQPDRDLEAEEAALAAERETLVDEARERLRGYPQPAVAHFEALLQAAQQATFLEEEHNYWIDYAGTYEARQVLLECGRRLTAAGSLARADDVCMLTLAELRAALQAPDGRDYRPLVAERRAEMDHFRGVTPPPLLGTMPPGPPPASPVALALAKFFGAPPPPPGDGILRGNPASPGTARGRVRVVRNLGEAGKVRKGDVLVAETTSPPWTPLFAVAGAVVTDIGGVLSHGAVVAREYRIPAVVGTGVATSALQDGQIVEVDGDTGEVLILDAS